MKNDILNQIIDFIFPPHCHICRNYTPDSTKLHICSNCFETFIPVTSPLCTICGTPFDGAGDDHLCGSCYNGSRHFNSSRAPYRFEGALKDLIHSYKYTPRPTLQKPLSILIDQSLHDYAKKLGADFIAPVPLHLKRLRQRGFNQALLLAETLSKTWQIRLERELLQRIRWTEPQVNLSDEERRNNVKGAFSINPSVDLNKKIILLIDDVFTTGSTVNECARTLKKSGATEVHVMTVAKA